MMTVRVKASGGQNAGDEVGNEEDAPTVRLRKAAENAGFYDPGIGTMQIVYILVTTSASRYSELGLFWAGQYYEMARFLRVGCLPTHHGS